MAAKPPQKFSLERQQVSRFPVEERAISLKRAVTNAAGQPFQKRARPALHPNPVHKPPNQRVYIPQGQTVQQPKPGSQRQGKSFRVPVQSNQAKVQQAKVQQAKVRQLAQGKKASSSGGNHSSASASHKR